MIRYSGTATTAVQGLTALLANHDFVLVGRRGAAGSVVLACPEIGQAINSAPGNLLGETALASNGAAAAWCNVRLQNGE